MMIIIVITKILSIRGVQKTNELKKSAEIDRTEFNFRFDFGAVQFQFEF